MSSENTAANFEQASRLKLRFSANVGLITAEDLWDLPLTSTRGDSLDAIARAIHRELKSSEEESFVVKATNTNKLAQLAFDIVMHVIDVKIADTEAAKIKAANKARKQQLLDLIADKQDESLKAMSAEELQAMVEAL